MRAPQHLVWARELDLERKPEADRPVQREARFHLGCGYAPLLLLREKTSSKLWVNGVVDVGPSVSQAEEDLLDGVEVRGGDDPEGLFSGAFIAECEREGLVDH